MNWMIALTGSFFIFLFQFLPTLLLHLNYYYLNRNDKLIIDLPNRKVLFNNGEDETRFDFDDIEYLTLNKSFALHKKNTHFLSWDSYNHALIKLKNGNEITITRLLFPSEINFPIEKEKIKVKQNLFRWAKGPSLR